MLVIHSTHMSWHTLIIQGNFVCNITACNHIFWGWLLVYYSALADCSNRLDLHVPFVPLSPQHQAQDVIEIQYTCALLNNNPGKRVFQNMGVSDKNILTKEWEFKTGDSGAMLYGSLYIYVITSLKISQSLFFKFVDKSNLEKGQTCRMTE